ncbi:MAG: hypothetical protein GY941_29615, partial [Planctomycetes bacterium]|nr:hypothetical protein [Planctomycetota bacterium]
MAVSPTQLFPNRVNSNGSNAVNGPTTGVDLGDATILTHTGTHYAYLSGAATGNFLSVPDDSTLDLTSDYEIVCWVGPTDWTPSGNMWLVRKGSAWAVQIRTDGKIRAIVNNNNYDSTIATGFTDGDAKWLKVTRDQSSGDIDIYTAADQATEPSSWDTLGTTIAGTTDATNTNTADVSIGAATTGAAEFGGCIYRAIVRDSIGAATDVLDVNLAADIDTTTDHDAGQTSFTCTTGQTVTVNRATSGLVTAIVTRPVALLDGSDDYIQLPADAPTPTFTATTGKYTIVY